MPDVVLPIPDTVPLKIVQQPNGDYTFVSNVDNTVTQFAMPKDKKGALGYLAHNTKAGANFSKLKVGDILAIKSEVPTTRGGYDKTVKSVRHFQALAPKSPTSAFLDLDSGTKYSADQLYNEIYGDSKNTVLQTCITKDGNDNWGRMFVIAGDK